ncbi:MAG: TetR family transcriptional regulator [Gemmatimonadetes bacterium]|nr:TetR family transcriptional regulator [Gemmatimonadota bacterium]
MNARRLQILDAAAALLCEKGYARTSVDDVIERAGLSGKSHFYHYFKSKEELGYEVIGRQFDLMAERGATILRDTAAAPLDRLTRFIDSVVALQIESGGKGGSPFGALGAELAEKDERFRLRLAQLFRGWSAQIQALLEEAHDQLSDDADPQRLSRFIVATLEGATQMARLKRDPSVLLGIATDLKRFICTNQRRMATS